MATIFETSKRAIGGVYQRMSTLILAAAFTTLPIVSVYAGVGIAYFEIGKGVGGHLKWMIFYPADADFQTTEIGPYDVTGLVGAKMKAGKFPLVVISHGSSAGMLSHHDMASYLAMSGFVVAAVEHAGDNYRDSSGLGRISTAYRRPREVSEVVDAMLEGPYGPGVDRDRIGVVGYSAGTVTALMLAGADPDFTVLEDYCRRIAEPIALCEGGGRLIAGDTNERSVTDPRIGAALLLAPIGAMFHDQAIEVDAPIGIVAAESDRELPIADHANPLSRQISTLSVFEIIPLAGHYVFLAPCSDALKAVKQEICSDPPFVDRQHEHALLNSLAVSFFNHSFDTKHRLDAVGR